MASSSKGKETLEEYYATLNIQNDDDAEVDLPYGEEDTTEVDSFMLVGTLITEKTVKFSYMKETLAKVWRPGKGMVAKEFSTNLYIFYFFHEKDRRRVLDDGPWTYEQNLLVLRKLEHGESPFNMDLTKAEFWVQIHKLPQKLSSMKMVEALGAHFGQFIKADLEHYDGSWNSFARLRVCMDITKPLRRKIRITPPGSESLTMECKYERLPTYCFVCGRIGHAERYCPSQFETQSYDLPREYGPELRAVGRKPQGSATKWLFDQFPTKKTQVAGDTSVDREQEPENVQNPRYEEPSRQNELDAAYCPKDISQSGEEQSYRGTCINDQVSIINGDMLEAGLELQNQLPVMGFLVVEQKKRKGAGGLSVTLDRPISEEDLSGLGEPMWVEENDDGYDPKKDYMIIDKQLVSCNMT